MSEKRGPVIDDAELSTHRAQRERWSRRAGHGRSDDLYGFGAINLITAYAFSIEGYAEARVRFPGRVTALSNAIRSLEATIQVMWFELEGDKL